MRVNTRITTNGIIEEKVFDPGATVAFNLEVPGTIASGDPIGTGGGGGGGDTTLLEAYIGLDTAAPKVGVVDLYTPQYMYSDFYKSTITIHDAGNGNPPRTVEFVMNSGDPATISPGAYTIPINTSPGVPKTINQIMNNIVNFINDGDSLFPPSAWSLRATNTGTKIKIEYTGNGGESGGEPAVADEMDVSFTATVFDPLKQLYFTKDNMSQTTLNGRLSLVEAGDGCIMVPLSHVANGTWSDLYPVHPNGITITAVSICPDSEWTVSGAPNSGNIVTLAIRKNNASGAHILGDYVGYIVSFGGSFSAYAGSYGFPMAMNIGIPDFPLGVYLTSTQRLTDILEDEGQAQLAGTDKIYVEVKSNDSGSTAPANGAAKIAIFYRVNPI